MAQFTLVWIADQLITNVNAIGQTVSYRQKSVGGSWLTAGFAPANPLSNVVETVESPVLTDNIVYEFKVECNCTENGPTPNDNGIQEGINFACIAPTFELFPTQINVIVDVTGTDITKARFVMRRADNNNIVHGPNTVNRIGDTVELLHTVLTPATNYYVQIDLLATINTIEVISNASNQLGTACSPYPVATEAAPVCDPITALTVSSIEVL